MANTPGPSKPYKNFEDVKPEEYSRRLRREFRQGEPAPKLPKSDAVTLQKANSKG